MGLSEINLFNVNGYSFLDYGGKVIHGFVTTICKKRMHLTLDSTSSVEYRMK